MTAEIITLPGTRRPTSAIAHYLRIGDTGHLQLDDLRAENRFPAQRVVVDASRFKYQKPLIEALRANDVEIVLDTKAAELAVPGRYSGYASQAPWAIKREGKILGQDHYCGANSEELIGEFARFVVECRVDAVLAPCHLLRDGTGDTWFKIDQRACEDLRVRLDAEGGAHIAIDYNLIIHHTFLRDEAIRGALIEGLHDLPFQNLWVRASGFGADGTPAGARHFINALSSLHNLGKPIISDHLGGLIGGAAVALGAISGLCHGVGEKERFDASRWDQPPPKRIDGEPRGRASRINVSGLDKSLTIPELNSLAKAWGGRRLMVCQDRQCCPHGLQDMIQNWKAHVLNQRFGSIKRLEEIPDLKRAEHFLNNDIAIADQLSRQIVKLKPVESELKPRKGETVRVAADKLMKRVAAHADRNEKLRSVLVSLNETRGLSAPRAAEAAFRGGKGANKQNHSETP